MVQVTRYIATDSDGCVNMFTVKPVRKYRQGDDGFWVRPENNGIITGEVIPLIQYNDISAIACILGIDKHRDMYYGMSFKDEPRKIIIDVIY